VWIILIINVNYYRRPWKILNFILKYSGRRSWIIYKYIQKYYRIAWDILIYLLKCRGRI